MNYTIPFFFIATVLFNKKWWIIIHYLYHCGAAVDSLGLHGLSCKKGRMRFHRHGATNDVLHHAFSSAGVPSCLEPSCLSRSDGKRPDGFTLVPWERGKPLVWDATVPDSLAHSYRSAALSGSGAAAALAESKKVSKYARLSPSYTFTPVAIELFGTLGPQSHSFVRSLGRRICLYTGDENAGLYLMQRLSVTVQCGNAALIMDALPSISSSFWLFSPPLGFYLDDIFFYSFCIIIILSVILMYMYTCTFPFHSIPFLPPPPSLSFSLSFNYFILYCTVLLLLSSLL